jgi:hypothetical protein
MDCWPSEGELRPGRWEACLSVKQAISFRFIRDAKSWRGLRIDHRRSRQDGKLTRKRITRLTAMPSLFF